MGRTRRPESPSPPPSPGVPGEGAGPRASFLRLVLLVLLLAAATAALVFLFFTDRGAAVRDLDHVRQIGPRFRGWVRHHPLRAPAIFVALYVALAVLALPVWWLQMLAGYGFGLVLGVLWSQVGASIGATITVRFSRWLAADWFADKVESRMERLHALSETLGHNGLLVVMAVRLVHFMPLGLSNYAFGLLRIRPREAFVGTLLGGIPGVAVYVTLGVGRHLLGNGWYVAGLAAVNSVLLVPLVLRYLKPQWFKRLGVE